MMRGVRGAVPVENNTAEAILTAAEKLMTALIESNSIRGADVSAVFFTVTTDLNASFPAAVRTRIGWQSVPFLCSQEIPVPNSMTGILRVLVLFETDLAQETIKHQYLGTAAALRPDLNHNRERP